MNNSNNKMPLKGDFIVTNPKEINGDMAEKLLEAGYETKKFNFEENEMSNLNSEKSVRLPFFRKNDFILEEWEWNNNKPLSALDFMDKIEFTEMLKKLEKLNNARKNETIANNEFSESE